MSTIVSVIISFILTSLVGNFLIQRWQQRTWIQQRRLMKAETEIEELRKLLEEIDALANTRVYRTRRLLWNLKNPDTELLESIRKEYNDAVAAWNEKINTFVVRIRMYTDSTLEYRFDKGIQPAFVTISESIDEYQKEASPATPRALLLYEKLEMKLNNISGKIYNLTKDLLQVLIKRQDQTYIGRRVTFSPQTMHLFSTLYLLKALFISHQTSQTIISPFIDPEPPSFFRR